MISLDIIKYLCLIVPLIQGCPLEQTLKPTRNIDQSIVTWLPTIDPCPPGKVGCALHIDTHCTIYALEPRYLRDDRMCTLGHEMYHCFRGSYHK